MIHDVRQSVRPSECPSVRVTVHNAITVTVVKKCNNNKNCASIKLNATKNKTKIKKIVFRDKKLKLAKSAKILTSRTR